MAERARSIDMVNIRDLALSYRRMPDGFIFQKYLKVAVGSKKLFSDVGVMRVRLLSVRFAPVVYKPRTLNLNQSRPWIVHKPKTRERRLIYCLDDHPNIPLLWFEFFLNVG